MAAADPVFRLGSPLPRASLALTCALHAVVFAWAARTLPWNDWTAFAIVAGAIALLHAATAVAALVRAALLRRLWRLLAIASLLFLGWCVWQVVVTTFFVAELYDGLGSGIAIAIAASLSGVVLFTLPFGCWGLARTGAAPSARATALVSLALGVLTAGGLLHARDAASAQPVGPAAADPAEWLERTTRWLPDFHALPRRRPRTEGTLDPDLVAVCDRPVVAGDPAATVVVHYLASDDAGNEARAHCAQGSGPEFEAELRTRLRGEALQRPIKIDWIRAAAPIGFGRVGPLEIRPGLDGVCLGRRCLMPWQLLLGDRFREIRPLDAVPDLRFGISTERIRAALGGDDPSASPGTSLVRIEVVSLVVDASGQLSPLERLRKSAPERDPLRFERAANAAERHIARLQSRGGSFRYAQFPTPRRQRMKLATLPRQAGVTLVVCELGRNAKRSERIARRSLGLLARLERRSGEHSFLSRWSTRHVVRLSHSALPLAAYLGCRERVGDSHDALIARLGSGILALQRADGSFAAEFDLDRGRAIPTAAPLYAEGQAILALTLLEDWAAANDPASHERIRAAVERAMRYVAEQYWSHPLRDFFFLEENWHCLAARAALDHHRHAAYEQFCLDYTRFRSRFALTAASGVAPDYVGGLGFGNLFAPQIVATAGFAETLAAAIEIHAARGSEAAPERELLERTLDFLIDQQWSPTRCFACKRPAWIDGGFSESPTSPRLRIDYTQHAWAAIGHAASLPEPE